MGGAVRDRTPGSDESQPLLDVATGSPDRAPSPPPARMGRQKRITSEPMLVDMETGKRTTGFGGGAAPEAANQGWRKYVTGEVSGFRLYACVHWRATRRAARRAAPYHTPQHCAASTMPRYVCVSPTASLTPGSVGACLLQYAALTIALVVLVLARTCDQTLYYRLNFSYSYFVWCATRAPRASLCARSTQRHTCSATPLTPLPPHAAGTFPL